MISFDRKAGNVNLTPVWDAINSIKSDTSSIWDFVSTITGIDIASSILSSISDINSVISSMSSEITSLNNNTSYFNNELYSLKTDTSSMVSDTAGLNMDIVSLYNICSSLSDSVSTITGGGGGGGPYYIALSDAEASSLKYVYNMTGGFDESLFPTYDDFSFCGNIGLLGNFSVPTTCLRFSLGNIDLISSLTIDSSAGNNITRTISLSCESCFNNTFYSIDHFYLTVDSLMTSNKIIYGRYHSYDINSLSGCTIQHVSGLKLNACSLERASIYYNTVLDFNVRNLSNCTLQNYFGDIKAYIINRDSSLRYYSNLNYITGNIMEANIISNQCVSYNVCLNKVRAYSFNNNLWCGNLFTVNSYNPTMEFGYAAYNTFGSIERDWTLKINDCSNNLFAGGAHPISSQTICKVDLGIYNMNDNNFSNIESVLIHGDYIKGNNCFYNVKWISFEPKISIQLRRVHGAGGSPPLFSKCAFVDLHNAGNSESFQILTPSSYFFNISTMRFNRDMTYNIYYSSDSPLQPSDINTIDFYKCDNYISNSTFTIPSVFASYDEGNVWISGKPLSELGYTLTTATA